ncbi:MAG: P-loop NTPase [candidate division WOR-3 bacterium]
MNKKEEILAILKEIIDPEIGRDIVSAGFVQDLEILDDKVLMRLVLTSIACPLKDYFKNEITKKLKEKFEWIKDVEIAIDAKSYDVFSQRKKVEGVKNIIAILSGKGGVGKSTVSINLAFALSEKGKKVGLLDADVYGPTISIMGGKGKIIFEDDKIIPYERDGVKIISLGYLTSKDAPIIWRGPLIHSALRQLLFDTKWGEIDYLIIDLPPGTGDPIISLSQLTYLKGGIAVTTPQDVAISDVRRAINMLFKLYIPFLGIIENMSYFKCDNCFKIHHIFGFSKIDEIAKEFNSEVLGRIQFDINLASSSDRGEIFVLKYKENETAKIFFEIAEKILKK